MFKDISQSRNHTGNLSLEFLDGVHAPKYNIQEARNHDANFALNLRENAFSEQGN